MPDFDEEPWSTLLSILRDDAIPIALIIVATYAAIRLAQLFVHGIVKTLLDREATEGTAQELSAVEIRKRMDTLDELGGRTLQAFIVVIGGLMVLGRLDLDIGPAIAGLGVVGIAVGFGAQSLVRDYLNGALILIENQFGKGDVIRVAGVAGSVEDFTLRRTTLRDLDGVVHTVPNGEIRVASNLTRVWSRINQDITVAYGTDIDKAINVVEALAEYGITLKVLGTVRAADQWAAGGDFRKRLLAAFKANGIEIPRPQRVVLARDPHDGGLDVGLAPDEEGPAEGID
jgi:small conductance mechanosensitive channel